MNYIMMYNKLLISMMHNIIIILAYIEATVGHCIHYVYIYASVFEYSCFNLESDRTVNLCNLYRKVAWIVRIMLNMCD